MTPKKKRDLEQDLRRELEKLVESHGAARTITNVGNGTFEVEYLDPEIPFTYNVLQVAVKFTGRSVEHIPPSLR